MAYTVLIWNLEEFGMKFGNADNPVPAQTEVVRCNLVAAIARAAQANAIVIQELRIQGVSKLQQLVAAVAADCGGTWHFDWLPGAIRAGVDTPAGFNDLGFGLVANHEGYAVIWRADALATVAGALSAGVDSTTYNATSNHYITLVTRGQTLMFNGAGVRITFGAPAAALGFPPSTCPDVNMVRINRSRNIAESNAVIASHALVRRPCAVVLVPAAGVTIPLVVYHAPVGQYGSDSDYYGTLIGFAAEQLQDPSAAYAGDFNVHQRGEQAELYEYSQRLGYNLNTYLGATGTPSPKPSIIRYINYTNRTYYTNTNVVHTARDYAFVKANGRNVTPCVFDALESLRVALLGPSGAALRNSVEHEIANRFTRVAGVYASDVVIRFLKNQALPTGTDVSTACAIIHRELISDHLPVAIRYEI